MRKKRPTGEQWSPKYLARAMLTVGPHHPELHSSIAKEIRKQLQPPKDSTTRDVLELVAMCFWSGIPAPEWLKQEFLRRYHSAAGQRSWDKIFGHPPTKDWLNRNARDLAQSVIVYEMVQEALAEPRPIDDELFEDIGGKLGWKKTKVKDLYLEERQRRDSS
jgi:hypothetical protein